MLRAGSVAAVFWILVASALRPYPYPKPYARSGKRSPADNCITDSKRHLPNRETAQRGLFQELEDLLEDAKANAQRTMIDGITTNNPNPSTERHCLVSSLRHPKTDAELQSVTGWILQARI